MHVSGAKLDQYTGVAAILRFPVDLCLADMEREASAAASAASSHSGSAAPRIGGAGAPKAVAGDARGGGGSKSKKHVNGGAAAGGGGDEGDMIDLTAASITDRAPHGSNMLVLSKSASDALESFEKACISGNLSFSQLLAYC